MQCDKIPICLSISNTTWLQHATKSIKNHCHSEILSKFNIIKYTYCVSDAIFIIHLSVHTEFSFNIHVYFKLNYSQSLSVWLKRSRNMICKHRTHLKPNNVHSKYLLSLPKCVSCCSSHDIAEIVSV